MYYSTTCNECGRQDGPFRDEDNAEHEALRHYAEDHGYSVGAHYTTDMDDYAWVRE